MNRRGTGTARRRLRWLLGAAIAVAAVAAAYAAIPRRADLAAFDPTEMARLETAMWRHYYEQRYFALFFDLYQVARREQGFSPLDSVRIALAAAHAARSFQPSTSRAQAEAAIPDLVAYFGLLARAAPVAVDRQEAARTELAWWQARREAASPEQYGAIIARASTLLYGVDNADIRRSGLVRAQAMDYRDARGADLTEADGSAIGDRLRLAYGLLKKAVSSRAR